MQQTVERTSQARNSSDEGHLHAAINQNVQVHVSKQDATLSGILIAATVNWQWHVTATNNDALQQQQSVSLTQSMFANSELWNEPEYQYHPASPFPNQYRSYN
jgi:hypothetical protein